MLQFLGTFSQNTQGKCRVLTSTSGDVHLAGVGQFYSNPKLNILRENDHRYMPNVISSAIVNTPPPNSRYC